MLSLLLFVLTQCHGDWGGVRKGPAKVGEGVPSDCSSAGTLGPAITSRSLFSGPDTQTRRHVGHRQGTMYIGDIPTQMLPYIREQHCCS